MDSMPALGVAVAVMQFEFEGQQVLGIEGADGNAYVVGMEVGNVLGYSNVSKAIKDHCKYPKLIRGNESLALGLNQWGVTLIPESDLYRLTIKSKMPEAEGFEKWMMEVVLPTIRKTGRFEMRKFKSDKEQALFRAQQLIEEFARNEKFTEETQSQRTPDRPRLRTRPRMR